MGIFSRKEKRTKTGTTDAVLTTPNAFGLTFAQLLNNTSPMAVSTVYRCISMIAESIAVLPIEVQTKDNKTIQNHQLYDVFDCNLNRLTKYNFMRLLMQSVLQRGNAFAYIYRNADGSVKSLRYLESGDVSIINDKQNNTLYYQCALISPKRIEPCNMIHLINQSFDGVNGISILSMANQSVKIAQATESSALQYYQNGGQLSGILKVNSHLTPQQIKDIKSSWATTYSGGGAGVAVLEGNMDFQAISQNAEQTQLVTTRQYNVKEICRYYGINPVLLGESGTQYSSIYAAQQEFILHTLLPYIVMIESEFTNKLLPTGANLKINLDENYLMKADKGVEATYFTTLVNAGIITRNEARKALQYESVEGGDELIIAYTNVEDNKINNTNTDE